MKIYCGDYSNWQPPRRVAWKKIALIVLCVGVTTAATPAMVSYYWSGRRSAQTLPVSEAIQLVRDGEAASPKRISAAGKLFFSANEAIKALKSSQVGNDTLASDSRVYLDKLAEHFRK